MRHLLFISIMGTEDLVRPGLYANHPEGEHDAEWLCRRLAETGEAAPRSLRRVDVCSGESLPAYGEVEAVIVGGSYHNVNEGRDWQLRTLDWLRGWRETARPFLGICGGHQMAGVVLGGRVSRMQIGPWASTERIELTDAGRRHYLFKGLDTSPAVHLGHYDHVDRSPAGAVLLAEREGVVQALDFGGDWLGLQFHPECSHSMMEYAWDGELGDISGRYQPAPGGGRLLANFLREHGLTEAGAPSRRAAS